MIEGRNAVLEAFRSGKCVDKLFILDGCQDGPVRTIAREARKHDTIVKFVPKERLDSMSETGAHQGVIAQVAAYDYSTVEDILKKAEEKMEKTTADVAWEQAVEETNNNLKEEDKNVLKMLSKLLGKTDTDGQISQIEITENFLEGQIKAAMEAKQKNERLYTRLGTIVGLAIVIVLC